MKETINTQRFTVRVDRKDGDYSTFRYATKAEAEKASDAFACLDLTRAVAVSENPVVVTRTEAASLIQALAILAMSPEYSDTVRATLSGLLSKVGMPVAAKCEGEAHSHGHADSCALCSPFWGVSVPRVVLR